MHIKFSGGRASAGRAAAYLTGELDSQGEERAGVTVLRGDPELVAAVADGLAFSHPTPPGFLPGLPTTNPPPPTSQPSSMSSSRPPGQA